MNNRAFRSLSTAEKRDRLDRVIRSRTGDVLGQRERAATLNAVDTGEQYSIRIFTDAQAFEKAITLRQVHVLTGDAEKTTTTTGQMLFGSFEFGTSELRTDALKRSSGKTRKAVLLDTEKPAAAMVETRNVGYEDLDVLMNVNELIFYIPAAAMEQAG